MCVCMFIVSSIVLNQLSKEGVEELAMDRVEWRRCVARGADMHRMGLINNHIEGQPNSPVIQCCSSSNRLTVQNDEL